MKVAIVHDYFNQYGGGERVAEALAEIWPEANIYTSIYDKKLMQGWLKIDPKRIKTNFISKLPFHNYLSKHYFFLYPLAFRVQNLENADIVISTTSYAAKFVRGKKGSIHICYIFTPPRFLWGYDTELTKYYHRPFDRYLSPVYNLAVPLAKRILQNLDYKVAQKVDYFISISEEVKKRVKKHYRLDSQMIYPPVDTDRFEGQDSEDKSQRGEYYLVVSRLGGYKKIDIVVKAFNKLGVSLKVVGDGPQFEYLKSIAKHNIELLGRLSDAEITQLILNCKALIFPTHEDFGIVPVEAMAAGKPVVAYRAGGSLETIVEGKTGVFFDEQTPEAIIKALKVLEKTNIDPRDCIEQAQKFSKEEFKKNIKKFVEETLKEVIK